MALINIPVPDIGDIADAAVIEILVKPGQAITAEQSIITLESDKASMEVPSPQAGVVGEIKVKLGDRVGQGQIVLTLDVAGVGSSASTPSAASAAPSSTTILVAAAPAVKAAAGDSATVASSTASPTAASVNAPADTDCDVLVLGGGPGGYSAAFRAADLNGGPAPGFSSGQAQAAIVKILNETLPKGMGFEWTELTYQQILAGNTAMIVFPICLLLVFLVLAAKYESLFLPLSIILIVPMCLLSAIVGVWITGGDNNIFTQIGLFVLAGLACKNAILIVEFAHELEGHGEKTVDAAIHAARMRLRPILMTSFAFIMGVIPLVTSTGAGAEMRHAMGVAVFSGMLGVTFFGLFLTPVFYVLMRMAEKALKKPKETKEVETF